jgi:hypothetical protein
VTCIEDLALLVELDIFEKCRNGVVVDEKRGEVDEIWADDKEGLVEVLSVVDGGFVNEEGGLTGLEEESVREDDDDDAIDLMGVATADSRLQALCGTVAIFRAKGVEREGEETFWVLDVLLTEEVTLGLGIVETNLETATGVPLTVEMTLTEDEDVLIDEVGFKVTVVFLAGLYIVTVEIFLMLEVARLIWEEEVGVGRNIWAIRLSKLMRACKELRERR